MSLKVKDLCNIIEDFAPISLKEDYDNVGLMLGDREDTVVGILTALDCTIKVIDEAIEKKCNMIITHHPILFKKPSSITNDTLLGKKIIKLIKNNINVYSAHTNLDSVKNGINDAIVNILGFDNSSILAKNFRAVKEAGIGRVVELEEGIQLKELCHRVKENLKVQNLRYCGNDDKKIQKIAIINGSGQDFFEEARKKGADCIITGDTSYHYVSDYNEMGMAVIDAGHFGTEWPSVIVMTKMLKDSLNSKGIDTSISVSQNNIDPYKIK
ncbi:Nif3-like dinuclear metal center hexameric protein [Clostridium felsineum]|uniref:Nif3-like dinuclear metal center hexameric protein n=1 Tax=Clostridium felsineum TaxID=36839 RepID=UPI00214D1A46|nr:Nif3-like dinuclear metal center hexameric protein [Clostridium felsineum]MCR3758181.1 Nif3-like dinuclear metal center hexameric protein [Clostridium felsineum]